jgi:hypothetical protein
VQAVQALGEIGSAAAPALPKLEALRKDEALREAAEKAIERIRR